MEIVTIIFITAFSMFIMRLALSIEKQLNHQKAIIKLLIGIGNKLDIEQRFYPTQKEANINYFQGNKS